MLLVNEGRSAVGNRLTAREKRLLVLGRLRESDASGQSDRALARELGVSQAFVSGIRRAEEAASTSTPPAAATRTLARGCGSPEGANAQTAVRRWTPGAHDAAADVLGVGEDDVLGGTQNSATTSQQALQRFHDEHSPLGRVRRVWRSVNDEDDTERARTAFDPFR